MDPLAGVDPGGFQSYYARELAVGRFSDPEANGASAAFTRLGVLYLNKQMPPWLRRLLGSGILEPLAKNLSVPRKKIDARPTKAENTDTALWCKALQPDQTPKCKPGEPVSNIRRHLEPQQVAVGVSGGCESIAIGAKLKFGEVRAEKLQNDLVLLDLKYALNAYKRAAARRAFEALAATDLSLRSLVLAHHPISSQSIPIYVRSSQTETGLKYLYEKSAGGGRGNALTSTTLPVVIDKALKAVESNGVEPRAQQGDIYL